MSVIERFEKKLDLIVDRIEGQGGIKEQLANTVAKIMVIQEVAHRIEGKVIEINGRCPGHDKRITYLENCKSAVGGGWTTLKILAIVASSLIALIISLVALFKKGG